MLQISKQLESFKQSRYFLAGGALFCSLLWGSAFPCIRLAHRYFDSEPFANHIAFAGIRFSIAGFVVLLFLNRKKEYWKACPKFGLLATALFQVVFQYSLFYWGLKLAPAVLGAILVSTGSFWWVLIAPLVDKKESINIKQFGALALGFSGVCVCVFTKSGGGENPYSGFLFVASCLCGVIAALMVRPISKKIPSTFLNGASLFCGGTILCLVNPQMTLGLIQNMRMELLLITLWLSVVSALAFSLWYYLITLFDVPRLSGYRMLIPVCGVLESVLILSDEKLTWNYLTGGLIVLSSIFILEKLKRSSVASKVSKT
ncbi:MAG: DMT family transporter [Lentisphaeraceae bacterium]|nr:DMT family transporter [Lentisphaeraceae bacterium]